MCSTCLSISDLYTLCLSLRKTDWAEEDVAQFFWELFLTGHSSTLYDHWWRRFCTSLSLSPSAQVTAWMGLLCVCRGTRTKQQCGFLCALFRRYAWANASIYLLHVFLNYIFSWQTVCCSEVVKKTKARGFHARTHTRARTHTHTHTHTTHTHTHTHTHTQRNK